MRILYGITKSNFGGAQRYVYDLALEAQKQGHKVGLVVGGQGVLIDRLKEHGVEIFPIEGLGRDVALVADIQAGFFICEAIAKFKPDVFHINSSKMGGIGAVAGRIMQVPHIIFTGHGWAFNEVWRPSWQRVVIKFFVWLSVMLNHKTICVSEKTKRDIAGMPFTKNKLVVIHNAIQPFDLRAREDARQKLVPGISAETLLVGSTGELHKVKGLDVLLHSWKEVKKSRNAKLVLMGIGDQEENLKHLAEDLGISDSIIFTGFVENARHLLPALDIFVMPSRSENLPYGILEAGVAGLPVVATAVGGIPEIIDSGKNGILVFRDDTESLTSALDKLADDARLRENLGENLKNTVRTKFALKEMVSKTLEVYRN